jgi:diguanylate cyclase (GGDEF)-like protein
VRALQGALLGIGSPLGWWGVAVAAGEDPVRAVTAHGVLFAYLFAGTVVAFSVFGAVLGHREDRLLQANHVLDVLSVSDPVTGLRNSRYFRARLAEAHQRATRRAGALSVIVVDLDHFKEVNDTWGHPVGDRVLLAVARALASTVRGGDTTARLDRDTARMGGEEFAVLLEGVDLVQAVAVAERLLDAIRAISVEAPGGPVRVTASAGLASTEGVVEGADELYARADTAMYAAKHAGRDRLILSGPLLASAAGGPDRETDA